MKWNSLPLVGSFHTCNSLCSLCIIIFQRRKVDRTFLVKVSTIPSRTKLMLAFLLFLFLRILLLVCQSCLFTIHNKAFLIPYIYLSTLLLQISNHLGVLKICPQPCVRGRIIYVKQGRMRNSELCVSSATTLCVDKHA